MDIGRGILLNTLPRHRLDAGTFGTMGVGPGFAIAAALYCRDFAPGKKVAHNFINMLLTSSCKILLPVKDSLIQTGHNRFSVKLDSDWSKSTKLLALKKERKVRKENFQVICVEGDSAFGFSGMEVETMVRYKLPVVIIIVNNNGIYSGFDKETFKEIQEMGNIGEV